MAEFISFSNKGDWSETDSFLKGLEKENYLSMLDQYAQKGVAALAAATPKDSGYTASCWSYEIKKDATGTSINFYNSHMNKGVSIAIILQYGHGTRNGGYVKGRDFINPAIRPVFDKIADSVWKEVQAL